MDQRPGGAMVAQLTPDQKVGGSNPLRVRRGTLLRTVKLLLLYFSSCFAHNVSVQFPASTYSFIYEHVCAYLFSSLERF